ncbi:MAG: hypothetical protein HYY05_06155 [Chloroflexi bacterium]|nr:hypothetical protein [Chloroflexota bacterium]
MKSDTPPEVMRFWQDLMRARSGEERLEMASSMYASARQLVAASLRQQHPGASDAHLRRGLLWRLYGDELSERQRESILADLAREGDGSGSAPMA